jgi:hypothetical protein
LVVERLILSTLTRPLAYGLTWNRYVAKWGNVEDLDEAKPIRWRCGVNYYKPFRSRFELSYKDPAICKM